MLRMLKRGWRLEWLKSIKMYFFKNYNVVFQQAPSLRSVRAVCLTDSKLSRVRAASVPASVPGGEGVWAQIYYLVFGGFKIISAFELFLPYFLVHPSKALGRAPGKILSYL